MNLKEVAENLTVYLYGYKGLSEYYKIHPRTLQRWDEKLKIPWEKMGFGKNSPVRIHILVADTYLKVLRGR